MNKTVAALVAVFAAIVLYQTCTLEQIKKCACATDSTTTAKAQFGMMQAQDTMENTEASMTYAGIDIVRVPIFYSSDTHNSTADKYLEDGFRVAFNFNWRPTSTVVAWPTDTNIIAQRATEFFKYYKKRRDQIPFVVCENEWDNQGYHSGPIEDYIMELRIVARIAHEFKFKIADAGITHTALQRWVYSQLDSTGQAWWTQHYFVGQNNGDYPKLVERINKYFEAVKTVDIDYLNFHWYNIDDCPKGLGVALRKLPQKFRFITNEWGVRAESIYDCTLNEMRLQKPAFCIVYSGVDEPGKAIRISDDNLKQMSLSF